MTPARRRLLVLGVLAAGVYPMARSFEGTTDFDGFHRAAASLVETRTLSQASTMMRYPPSFQLLMFPLSLLPLAVAAGVFYLLSAGALIALPREIERLSGVPWRGQLPAWLIMSPVIADNLALGQSGPLLLYLAAAGTARAREARPVLGGALLGLAALWKLLPIMLLGVPLLMRRTRGTLAGLLLALAAAALIGSLLVGPGEVVAGTRRWIEYTSEKQTHWALAQGGITLRYNNQSLAITLARTFGDIDLSRAKGAVPLARLPLQTIWILVGALAAALAALALAAGLAARRLDTPRAWLSLFGLACIGILIPSPIVWTHYFIWMLPGLVAVAGRRRLMLIGGSIFVLGFVSQSARALGLHLFCALGLFVLLAVDLIREARGAQPERLPAASTSSTSSPPVL